MISSYHVCSTKRVETKILACSSLTRVDRFIKSRTNDIQSLATYLLCAVWLSVRTCFNFFSRNYAYFDCQKLLWEASVLFQNKNLSEAITFPRKVSREMYIKAALRKPVQRAWLTTYKCTVNVVWENLQEHKKADFITVDRNQNRDPSYPNRHQGFIWLVTTE